MKTNLVTIYILGVINNGDALPETIEVIEGAESPTIVTIDNYTTAPASSTGIDLTFRQNSDSVLSFV